MAFIFNAHYNITEGLGTMIKLPDDTFVPMSELIADAVNAWSGGSDAARNEIKTLLDWFNNNDNVEFLAISPVPCAFDPDPICGDED